jgi:hypothetical protein
MPHKWGRARPRKPKRAAHAPAKDCPEAMSSFSDEFWQSPDGLTLHYRDYAGGRRPAPVLCLPGLTRNARDFRGWPSARPVFA